MGCLDHQNLTGLYRAPNQESITMDTLQPKLYRISMYEYYCSECSTLCEVDDLPFFRPHHECHNCGNNAFLKTVRDKDEWVLCRGAPQDGGLQDVVRVRGSWRAPNVSGTTTRTSLLLTHRSYCICPRIFVLKPEPKTYIVSGLCPELPRQSAMLSDLYHPRRTSILTE